MAPDSESQPRVPWLPVSEGAKEFSDVPAQPAAPEPDPLTPTKPTVPAWIRRDDVPQPVEAEEGEVVAPVAPPAAEEVLPTPGTVPSAPPEDTPPPGLWNNDAVHLLGESAVTSAALSAGGAPTPLGGVPTVAPEEAVDAPPFGDGAPLFTPRFEAPTGEEADEDTDVEVPQLEPLEETTPTHREKADALAAGIIAEEQSRLASRDVSLDVGTEYTPRSFADEVPTEVLPPMPRTEPSVPPELPAASGPQEPEKPKRRLWWLWVLLGLVAIGAAATLYALNNKPDPIIEPGAVITMTPPGPTITPTPAPTGSTFQAAMPTTVGTYSLVEAVALDPADIALTAGRVADGVDLTYRSGDNTMKVRALQYFNEDDATTMFTSYVGEGANTTPVEAGDETVGESAIITSPRPGIVWRNGTSVFILFGPPLELAEFQEQFGL